VNFSNYGPYEAHNQHLRDAGVFLSKFPGDRLARIDVVLWLFPKKAQGNPCITRLKPTPVTLAMGADPAAVPPIMSFPQFPEDPPTGARANRATRNLLRGNLLRDVDAFDAFRPFPPVLTFV